MLGTIKTKIQIHFEFASFLDKNKVNCSNAECIEDELNWIILLFNFFKEKGKAL